MFAGVDINARLPHTWGAATAYALPAGLVLDVELPARWPFDGHTPLRTALVMGNLRTAEALLAAGARQKPAWDALRRIATAQPGEEGLQRMRAAAALLLAHGLPAEEGAVWEAHRVAAELAWPQRQADPEDPWVLSRLLQAHLQAGSGGATQYGQQRGGGVSKDVMERVQVSRRSVNLFFRQNHSLLLMLDSRGCLAVGVSKGCDGAGAGAEDGLGCLRSQLCFLL